MTIDEIIQSVLSKIDYIEPSKIPNIDLYMDQITTFMSDNLNKTKRYEDDKIITKTMINNYTKNDLLPPPIKKKYTKEHILVLVFIYYFKSILSINDIKSLLEPLTEKYFDSSKEISLETIYKEIFDLENEQLAILKDDVMERLNRSTELFENADDVDKDFLQTFTFICMLSFDIYTKKQIIEQIIDDINKKI